MRKLLAVLGTVSIISSSMAITSCATVGGIQALIIKKVGNYINISSLLARGTILSQVNNGQQESVDGRGFSLDYATQYLQEKKITDFFGEKDYKFTKDDSVLSFFGSMYGNTSATDRVTVKKFSDFTTNLNLADDVNQGRTGAAPFLNTYNLITGIVSLIFGSDFSAISSGTLLENLLSSFDDKIGSMIGLDTIKSILNFIRIKDNEDKPGEWIFKSLSSLLDEKDLLADSDKELTDFSFDEVFQKRKVLFARGIIELLFSGNEAFLKKTDKEKWKAIENGEWTKLIARSIANKSPEEEKINVAINALFFEGLAKVLKYLRTVFFFVQSIEISDDTNVENILDISQISDPYYLFSNKVDNSRYIYKKLEAKYVNPKTVLVESEERPKIVQWIKNKKDNSLAQTINIQSIIAIFQNLFSVDLIKDPNGYAMQRILAILLVVPLSEQSKDDKGNPVGDLILDDLVKELLVALTGESLVGLVSRSIFSGLRTTLVSSWPLWKDPESGLSFLSLLAMIRTLILKDNPEAQKVIEKLENEIKEEKKRVDNDKNKEFNSMYGNPFRFLFSGKLLPKIFEAINSIVAIPQKVQNIFQSLSGFLTTKIDNIIKAFDLDLGNYEMYLFALKTESLTTTFNSIAREFEIRHYQSIDQMQKYLVNLGVVQSVLDTLNTNVAIKFTNNQIPKEFVDDFYWFDKENFQTNIINALLISGLSFNSIESLKINEDIWIQNKTNVSYLTFLLGHSRNDKNVIYFRENSLFGKLEQFYGHWVNGAVNPWPEKVNEINRDSIRKVISESILLGNWFKNRSLKEYIAYYFEPYFNSKRWSMQMISYDNIQDTSKEAKIIYKLIYKNIENKTISTYQVVIKREKQDRDNNDWFDLGKWKIGSIDFLNRE